MIKIWNKPDNVWVTSDLHLGHKNIIRGLSTWENDGMRDFPSVEVMNETILSNINSRAKKDDTLIILGDLMFGDKNYDMLFNRLECEDVIIIAGNHDRMDNLKKACDEFGFPLFPYGTDALINNKIYVLSHYPILSWNNMARGSTLLYGHVHSSINETDNPMTEYFRSLRTLDAGVDSAKCLLGEYRPFNLGQDILPMLEGKGIKSMVDYH